MSHQITGVGLAAVSAAAVDASAPTAALLIGSAWIGSLLPDADRAGTRIYRRTPIERRLPLLRPLGTLARMTLRLLIVLPHRGPTRSLFGCAVAAALAAAFAALVVPVIVPVVAAGVTIGYLARAVAMTCARRHRRERGARQAPQEMRALLLATRSVPADQSARARPDRP